MFSRILVPIDFSEYTPDILTYATGIAQKFSSTIHLIHVIPEMNYFASFESFVTAVTAENIVSMWEGIETEVEKNLAKAANTITGISVTTAIRRGVSFVEIVKYVRTEGIDLVIMATHGMGGLKLIIGSAAEKVVRKSSCPVLTIRPAKKQFKGT